MLKLDQLKKGKKYIGNDDNIVKTVLFVGKTLVVYEYAVTYEPPGRGIAEVAVCVGTFLTHNKDFKAKRKLPPNIYIG